MTRLLYVIECTQSYGENCQHPCSPHCFNQTCDRFSGRCLLCCTDTFHGERCDASKTLFFCICLHVDDDMKVIYLNNWRLFSKPCVRCINFINIYQRQKRGFFKLTCNNVLTLCLYGTMCILSCRTYIAETKCIDFKHLGYWIISIACYKLYFYRWCLSIMQVV